MTRVPTGSFSREKPSPRQNSVGGVDRSTSRMNPGRGISARPCRFGCWNRPLRGRFRHPKAGASDVRAVARSAVPLVAEVEGDLDGAPRAGVGGVLDGLGVAVEGVGRREQALE